MLVYIYIPSKPPRDWNEVVQTAGPAGPLHSQLDAASTLPGTPVPSTMVYFCEHQALEDRAGFRTEPPWGHFPIQWWPRISWEHSGQWALGWPSSHCFSLTALQSQAASPFTCEQQAWGFCELFRPLLSTSSGHWLLVFLFPLCIKQKFPTRRSQYEICFSKTWQWFSFPFLNKGKYTKTRITTNWNYTYDACMKFHVHILV